MRLVAAGAVALCAALTPGGAFAQSGESDGRCCNVQFALDPLAGASARFGGPGGFTGYFTSGLYGDFTVGRRVDQVDPLGARFGLWAETRWDWGSPLSTTAFQGGALVQLLTRRSDQHPLRTPTLQLGAGAAYLLDETNSSGAYLGRPAFVARAYFGVRSGKTLALFMLGFVAEYRYQLDTLRGNLPEHDVFVGFEIEPLGGLVMLFTGG